MIKPDLLFEVSWEICNKVGGIHTVISSKVPFVVNNITSNYVLIAPLMKESTEFQYDDTLFPELCASCHEKGVVIKCGRWLIDSFPIVIMVDFSYLIPKKDEILGEFWKRYNVNSLAGNWDYIEPLLFGYAAAQVIEDYVNTYSTPSETVVAHFHEWLTGSGVLYLKGSMSNIVTVFTTHATVLGRSLSGDGGNIYNNNFQINNNESLVQNYGIEAKHSMEKAASKVADGFSSVSDITALETVKLLDSHVDIVTPNGFDIDMSSEVLSEKRAKSRVQLLRVADLLLEKKFADDTFIALISGRYEFRNKGVDVVIDAMKIIADELQDRDIILYITMPANNSGVIEKLGGEAQEEKLSSNITNYLSNYDHDLIVNMIKDSPLVEGRSRVQVIFVPEYVHAEDGIFNLSYYDMLCGVDLSIFPSFYEPWGYTPLESIAFGVPTITSSLSGFGQWVNKIGKADDIVTVINRNNAVYEDVVLELKEVITKYLSYTHNDFTDIRNRAISFAKIFSWNNMIKYYLELYEKSLSNNKGVLLYGINDKDSNHDTSKPLWRRIMIERDIPNELNKLTVLAHNLWITWSGDADNIFPYIDANVWKRVNYNPISFFDEVASTRLDAVIADEKFMTMVDDAYDRFQRYMSKPLRNDVPSIAYFSMEYGLVNFLKIYSGGLGVLAGDYLKEASDRAVPLVAIGLFYRYGYFTQKVSSQGDQEEVPEFQNFFKLPISPVRDDNGIWHTISVNIGGNNVIARIWLCMVGRVSLYLLDTDYEQNSDENRTITHWLYGGNRDVRIRQEILLGIGGVKALAKLGIKSDIYHCNEGHAAFLNIQRLAYLVNDGIEYHVAKELIRASSLFTTHTPVPAGHDYFSVEMIKKYIGDYAEKLGISIDELLMLGISSENDVTALREPFSMSNLAVRLSGAIGGVSRIHGEITREMFSSLWSGYFPSELPIEYVTNGVHIPTWLAKPMRKIYENMFKCDILDQSYENYNWEEIYNFNSAELWNVRLEMKDRLIKMVKRKISDPANFKFDSPRQMLKVKETFSPDVLTIGFARRYATYKRGTLLLSNLERLDAIVNNPKQPVQIIFAGKAHPSDKAGAEIIKHIVQVAAMPQFMGKIIFLQNYNIQLAKKLCSGVDIWLNTPIRKMEASGTSGQKCAINGVLNLSVLDGWWVEGYDKSCGWSLSKKSRFLEENHQDEYDSEILYNIIEQEIAPLYYKRDENNIPIEWMDMVKNSIVKIGSVFNTGRMLDDYINKFYNPLAARSALYKDGGISKAVELGEWKNKILTGWDSVKVLSVRQFDMNRAEVKKGDPFLTEVSVDLGQLSAVDIGVELVVARQIEDGKIEIVKVHELDMKSVSDNIAIYNKNEIIENSGTYEITIRLFVKNKNLLSRFDFPIVKWS